MRVLSLARARAQLTRNLAASRKNDRDVEEYKEKGGRLGGGTERKWSSTMHREECKTEGGAAGSNDREIAECDTENEEMKGK